MSLMQPITGQVIYLIGDAGLKTVQRHKSGRRRDVSDLLNATQLRLLEGELRLLQLPCISDESWAGTAIVRDTEQKEQRQYTSKTNKNKKAKAYEWVSKAKHIKAPTTKLLVPLWFTQSKLRIFRSC